MQEEKKRWRKTATLLKLLFVGGVYWLGVTTSEETRKTYHNTFDKNQKVERGFNKDIYDIKVERTKNANGRTELYLVNDGTNERLMIGPDLVTGTIDERLESIKRELESDLRKTYSTRVVDIARQLMQPEY